MSNMMPPGLSDDDLQAIAKRFTEYNEACNNPRGRRIQQLLSEENRLPHYSDSAKMIHDEFLLDTLLEISDVQQQMLEDAERDRQTFELDRQLAMRESHKNTAILIFTVLGVLVTATGVILTALL